jgi:two-component sensor histidine kinase
LSTHFTISRSSLVFLIVFFWGFTSNAQVDVAFFDRINDLIYINQFDSAEIKLRDKLSEDKLSSENYLYAHIHLAKLYLKLADTTSWRKEINFCKDFMSGKKNTALQAVYYSELCQQYFTMLKYDSAQSFGVKYMNLQQQTSSKDFGHISAILGYCQFRNQKYQEAESFYIQAENYFISKGYRCELPLVYNKMALLKSALNEHDQAYELTRLSLQIADSCHIEEYKLNTYLVLVQLYSKQERYKEAFLAQKELTKLQTKINADYVNFRINELRGKYEMDDQEKRLTKAERDSSLKGNTLNYLFGFIVVLLILLGLLFFFYQKIRKANRFIIQQTSKLTQQNIIIQDTLKQKDFLYRELNHRIKNNLQLITSMLNLQDRYSHHSSYKELISEINQKINTIALTYAKMYVDNRKTNDIINLKEYLIEIAQNVLSTISSGEIKLSFHCREVSTTLDIAIPLGLITNELITNSVKHAFATCEDPMIILELYEMNDIIYFAVKDNGVGIDSHFRIESADSLGSKIIHLLSSQIKAKMAIYNNDGTLFTFEIKNLKTTA